VSRAEFIDAVRAQAFDEGESCEHCDGTGRAYPGRRIVHCVGSFTGADWDEAGVIAEIEDAREVRWVPNGLPGGHNLAVLTAEGRTWRFQVERPAAQPPS
jgi:hypothetical protein